jgi:hypothetical protein
MQVKYLSCRSRQDISTLMVRPAHDKALRSITHSSDGCFSVSVPLFIEHFAALRIAVTDVPLQVRMLAVDTIAKQPEPVLPPLPALEEVEQS